MLPGLLSQLLCQRAGDGARGGASREPGAALRRRQRQSMRALVSVPACPHFCSYLFLLPTACCAAVSVCDPNPPALARPPKIQTPPCSEFEAQHSFVYFNASRTAYDGLNAAGLSVVSTAAGAPCRAASRASYPLLLHLPTANAGIHCLPPRSLASTRPPAMKHRHALPPPLANGRRAPTGRRMCRSTTRGTGGGMMPTTPFRSR